MKRYIARHVLIAKLAALALLIICLMQLPVGARVRALVADPMPLPANDHRDGPRISLPPVGFVPGQTLRLNIFNPHDEEKGPTSLKTLAVHVTLFDARGNQIAQSAEVTIPAGGFHSFDFNRNALPLAGEAGTGRIQTRAQVHYRAFPLVDRSKLIFPHASIELIENITGKTTAVWITTGFFEITPHETHSEPPNTQ